MTNVHAASLIAAASAVTILLRFLPFAVFRGRQTPALIGYLGKVLPYAIMGMLVVYCLKDTHVLSYPYGIPELAACAVTAIMHIYKRNTLISIVAGTVFYMLLVQLVL